MKTSVLGLLFLAGLVAVQAEYSTVKSWSSFTKPPAQSCTSDADCQDGCCAKAKDGSGMTCQRLAKQNEICDLEGQKLALGVCQCEQGLTCEKIDLGEFGKDAEAVNPIFEKRHYGWCM